MNQRLASTPSGDPPAARNRGWRPRLVSGLLVVGVLATLLPLLATTLDDIDPFNFALGVRDFDPLRHQPHPPGYPIYIALAKVSTAVLDAWRPEPTGGPVSGQRNAAQGLAFWSALAGALALLPLVAIFRLIVAPAGVTGVAAFAGAGVRGRDGTAAPITRPIVFGAAAITVAAPLFWFTSLRPLSDVPGLVAVVGVQVLILRARGVSLGGAGGGSADFRVWALAGLATALAVGLRSQTLWLTMPLFVVAILGPIRKGSRPAAMGALAGLVAGGLAWAVPLVIASGGPAAYVTALGSQGAEDFAGVDMLYRQPTPRRFALGLLHTFVWPWATIPLATVVNALALVGAGWLAWRAPAVIGWLAAAFGPYALFHLLFHETITTRYALPLMPPVACLASAGAWLIARRLQPLAVGAIAAAGLAAAVPAAWSYAAEGSPIARAVTAMTDRVQRDDPRPVLAMHERLDRDTRRALQWMIGERTFWSERFPARPGQEVHQVLAAWRRGERRPVWFVASPRRTDLALIDPAGVRLEGDYDWPFASETFTGNTRPDRVLWYELAAPGWFLDRGWALTPELAGASEREGRGPSRGPIDAWVRRRAGATTLLVGGRNLGRAGDPRARIVVTIDTRPVASIEADPDPGFFVRLFPLPAGTLAGEGEFARLSIQARVADGSARSAPVAIEQFDLQDQDRLVFGFDRGWHEQEYNPATGLRWRWASDRATLIVHPGEGDVRVRVSGESPRRYYDRAPVVSLLAKDRVLYRAEPSRDFRFEIAVPRVTLVETGGLLSLTSSLSFVPDEREGNGDRRRLGLRIYEVAMTRR